MRLLKRLPDGELSLTSFDDDDDVPPYAILSHTWVKDQEISYQELTSRTGKNKAGYDKIKFCIDQAAADGLGYAWVDTCCIDKSTSDELSHAINSMFRWYKSAAKCYVYLIDVKLPAGITVPQEFQVTWDHAFRRSRWFTRGWTLQELLAPATVDFYSAERQWLGSKITLEREIQEVTKLPIKALRNPRLSEFGVEERMKWAAKRTTTKKEDRAYCLFGIFDICLPLIYGEGEEKAMRRVQEEVARRHPEQMVQTTWDTLGPSTDPEMTSQRVVMPRLKSSPTATVTRPSQALQRTDTNRKRALGVGEGMSLNAQDDAVRTAIEKRQELSNYMQTQLQDKPARKLATRLRVILDATKRSGCLEHGHQEKQWSTIRDSMVLWRRVSVNHGVPKIKPSPGSHIDRKTDHFSFERWKITLHTTQIRSYDEHGREVVQSLSSLQLQPGCSTTGTPIAVFFGEQANFFSTSIIHPVILAYRAIPENSEIFQLVENDDVEGLKRLLMEQKATTRDCNQYGTSLLGVGVHCEPVSIFPSEHY